MKTTKTMCLKIYIENLTELESLPYFKYNKNATINEAIKRGIPLMKEDLKKKLMES